ncbi:hypothetical protein EC970259_3569 [Escherichia coli 99.0741]|nr:hypothetical protein EC970259_3569 [Escherichia coli 99.0741]
MGAQHIASHNDFDIILLSRICFRHCVLFFGISSESVVSGA